ncbi:MAG: DUF3473 domain-containing protein [Candidatus Omnitrophica bacterium]|nr:DUF3473 domain-containing protein [Candidatus Omnitrophota bacterium]
MVNGKSVYFSVDVEDWYVAENLKGPIIREIWPSLEERARRNTEKILELLGRNNAKATFFILGYMARRDPGLVKHIAAAGHEIASHGMAHRLIYEQDPEDFRRDVTDSKKLLEDLSGRKVKGYRAPTFSITDRAVDILKESGYEYDSSLFPFSAHDRYGRLREQPVKGVRGLLSFNNGLYEAPLSMLKIPGGSFPWSGGGYFRLLPYYIFRAGVRYILASQGEYLFYIHPWDIDHAQPRVKGIKFFDRFRHYVNLKKAYSKLSAFSADFEFEPIEKMFREKETRESTV